MDTPSSTPIFTQNQISNEQPVAPIPAMPEQPNPVYEKPPFITKKIIIITVIVLAIIGGTLLATTLTRKKPTPVVPTPTPTSTPTPTPMRKFSPVASDSAFLSIESSIASLSGYLNSLQMIDSSLAPPTVELLLGFN